VCNRYVLFRAGAWVQAPDPDNGPFAPWDGKAGPSA